MDFERYRKAYISEAEIEDFLENPEVEIFVKAMKTVEFGSPLYIQLAKHFAAEMNRAINGRICTPERMIQFYPIFREINIELDKIEAQEKEFDGADKLFEHNLQIRTNKICHVLASDKISEDAKEAFNGIILEAANEAGISGGDPEIVRVAFSKIIHALDYEYGKGIYHAIGSLLDSNLVHPIEDELTQYEKRFEPEEKSEPLDLSEMSAIHDSPSLEKLAEQLSEIMQNPLLPEKLHDCFDEQLSTISINIHTPENVLYNLKKLTKREGEN